MKDMGGCVQVGGARYPVDRLSIQERGTQTNRNVSWKKEEIFDISENALHSYHGKSLNSVEISLLQRLDLWKNRISHMVHSGGRR